MNAQKWGVIRELVAGVGGAAAVYGLLQESVASAIVGSLLAIIALVAALESKDEGKDMILTLIRKVLSTGGGALVAVGLVNPEQVESLSGIVMPIIAIVWSTRDNGKLKD